MNILILAYTIYPDSGSEPGNSWNLASILAHSGHSVTVITQDKYRNRIGINPPFQVVYRKRGYLEKIIPHGIFGLYLNYFLWQKRVSRYLKRNTFTQFDVAHHISWGNFWLGTGISSLSIPTVFGPCGYQESPKQFRLYFAKSWKNEIIREALLKYFFSKTRFFKLSIAKSTVLLSANHGAKLKLHELTGRSSELFMIEGANTITYQTDEQILNRRQEDLLWVGRFMPRKGLEILIHAVNLLVLDFPNLRLTMVGDGEDLIKIRKLVTELNLDSHVIFTGRLSHSEVIRMMKNFRAMVFPSLRESTGAQVLEAASSGVPSVFFDFVGTNTWFNERNSYIAKTDSYPDFSLVDIFSQTIRQCITDPHDTYLNRTRLLYILAEKNLWEKKIGSFLDIYIEAISRNMSQ